MIKQRKSDQRGSADHGWLKTFYTFSFAGYQDPEHMRFRSLRVMNEDRIAPGRGFGTHPHDNMEIITYVLEGSLEHKDSMGHGEVLKPGEFQCISAGSGITHSEFNPSEDQPCHLYQIWLFPNVQNAEPRYQQRRFDAARRLNQLQCVASPDGGEDALSIRQDASIHLLDLDGSTEVTHPIANGRHAWVQVLRGSVRVNDTEATAGDGMAVSEERQLQFGSDDAAELMVFDLG